MVKVPPVDAESVTATLVALTCTTSAVEPVAIMSVVAGDDSEIDAPVAKLIAAAFALPVRMTSPSMPRKAERMKSCRLVSEYNTGFVCPISPVM